MGNKAQKPIDLKHKQKAEGKERRIKKAVESQVKHELEVAGIKASIEGHQVAVATFYIGLFLLFGLLIYVAGALIYG